MLNEEITCRSCDTLLSIPFEGKLNIYACSVCIIEIKTQIKNKHPRAEFGLRTNKILCIDFGTSSIRASVRENDGAPIALQIGEAFNSSIDKASIPDLEIFSPRVLKLGGDEIILSQKSLSTSSTGEFQIAPVNLKNKIRIENMSNLITPVLIPPEIEVDLLNPYYLRYLFKMIEFMRIY
jgi:hypothetical protein